MQRVLSEQFVSSFLIPYIKVNILARTEKDPILQKIFTTEVPLQDEEKTALDVNYFKNTATIFETDLKLRRVFWNEFTTFVRRQRKICTDNMRLLAFRTLPDSVTHEFSNEAQQNLLKFAYQVVSAVQNYKIAQHINNKEMNGEFKPPSKAQDLKDKLEKGKLVLVKDKEGRDKVLEDEEIKRALANVAYQSELYSGMETEGTGEEKVVFADEIPPQQLEGQPGQRPRGITLDNLQLEIYEKQAIQVEVMLEDSGMFVEGKMKADKTGMVRGYVIDKKTRERLLVEVNVSKPNSKFRFVFEQKPGSNKPAKSFLADKKEIQKYFKDENRSADEVNEIKEKEGMEHQEMFPAKAPEEPKKKAEPGGEAPTTGLAATSRLPQAQAEGDFRRVASVGQNVPINIQAAKYAYLKKRLLPTIKQGKRAAYLQPSAEAPEEEYQGGQEQPGPEYAHTGAGELPANAVEPEVPKKVMSPAKVTGIACAVGIGGSAILSFFT